MIRREQAGRFYLITQHAHAQLSGQLARHVGNDRFARPVPHEPTMLGIALHDSGWPLHDDVPTLNKRGEPLDVFESTRPIALAVWTASADRAEQVDPYAGLLTSLHVLALSHFAMTQTQFAHEKFTPQDVFEANKFQHRELERQERLRQHLGLRIDQPLDHGLRLEPGDEAEDQLLANFRLLQAMDQLSLGLCCTAPPAARTAEVYERPGGTAYRLSVRRDGNDLLVDPWPFDVRVIEVTVTARSLPKQTFADETAFRAAYDLAPAETIAANVRPAPV